MLARGAAVGDVRAPTRALARVKAERKAQARAAHKLRGALAGLAVAGGSTVAADERGFAFLEGPMASEMVTVERDYGADGSVVVTMGLPVEALRAAIFGRDSRREAGGPAALVVRARGPIEPVVGLVLSSGSVRYRGCVVYVDSLEKARAMAGDEAPQAIASKVEEGVAHLAPGVDLERVAKARALVVIARKP